MTVKIMVFNFLCMGLLASLVIFCSHGLYVSGLSEDKYSHRHISFWFFDSWHGFPLGQTNKFIGIRWTFGLSPSHTGRGQILS
jgi:hypothetical protein